MPFGGGAFTDSSGSETHHQRTMKSPMPFGGGAFTDIKTAVRAGATVHESPMPFGGGAFTDTNDKQQGIIQAWHVTNAFRRGGLHGLRPCKSLTLCGSSAQQVGTWFGRDGLNGLDTFLGAIFGGNWLKYSGLWP